jgi:putative flippase GtrA
VKALADRCATWLRSGGGGRQLSGYVAIGVLQLLIDWGAYVALTAGGLDTVLANPAARACGAIFGYVGNGLYTFRHPEGQHRLGGGSLWRFVLLWLGLTVVSTVALQAIDAVAGLGWAWVLKPVVDATLAFVAFLASRLWVYRTRPRTWRRGRAWRSSPAPFSPGSGPPNTGGRLQGDARRGDSGWNVPRRG